MLIVSSPDGRLLRRAADGSLDLHADLGRPGWNDIVIDGRGNADVNGAGFSCDGSPARLSEAGAGQPRPGPCPPARPG
jgi:hypothetical protein